MANPGTGNLYARLSRETEEMTSSIRDVATSVRDTFRHGSFKDVPKRINEPRGIDPIKFRKFLFTLIKLLIIFEFLSAVGDGVGRSDWGRLGKDCVIAGIVYIMWDRIKSVVAQKKDEYRHKMERSNGTIKLFDALVFSLLWSDEIYTDIPVDMRSLVVIAYTLIAISIGAVFIGVGQGLVGLILCSSLILGAVNLLAWVMSRERGEKESLKTELKLAHDVQVSLMPKEHPRVEGFDIAGRSIPAKEVGGDHFDYAYPRNDSSNFFVCVFDVSGKGMQAAMSAVFTSGAFASEVKQSSSVAEILTRLNKAVYSHSRRGHFVAFLLAMIDMDNRTLSFANAGQMKPLLASHGTVEWLESNGVHFPLGMQENSTYEERIVQLEKGDTFCFLTDGFTEAMNSTKEQYGMERLEGVIRQFETNRMSSEKVLDSIVHAVEGFAGDAAQHDDMTMVIIQTS